jgi:hypothetical protein
MARRLTPHVCRCQASEVVVEEGYELIESLPPAVARGDEQLRRPHYLTGSLIHRMASRIGENGANPQGGA